MKRALLVLVALATSGCPPQKRCAEVKTERVWEDGQILTVPMANGTIMSIPLPGQFVDLEVCVRWVRVDGGASR